MDKTITIISRTIIILLVAAFLVGLAWGLVWLSKDKELREEFDAVCTYEGGTVEGDVCIKDEKVILYKKTLDLEHQD